MRRLGCTAWEGNGDVAGYPHPTRTALCVAEVCEAYRILSFIFVTTLRISQRRKLCQQILKTSIDSSAWMDQALYLDSYIQREQGR